MAIDLYATFQRRRQKKEEEQKNQFNIFNSLLSAAASFVASGGNPLAAAASAVAAPRGGEVKPLRAVGKGVAGGASLRSITEGKTGVGETLSSLAPTTPEKMITTGQFVRGLTGEQTPAESLINISTAQRQFAAEEETRKEKASTKKEKLSKLKTEGDFTSSGVLNLYKANLSMMNTDDAIKETFNVLKTFKPDTSWTPKEISNLNSGDGVGDSGLIENKIKSLKDSKITRSQALKTFRKEKKQLKEAGIDVVKFESAIRKLPRFYIFKGEFSGDI
jgi:hypothetical protein